MSGQTSCDNSHHVSFQERVGTITNRDIISAAEGSTELEVQKIAEYRWLAQMSNSQYLIFLDRLSEKNKPSTTIAKRLRLKIEAMIAKKRWENYERRLHKLETGVLSSLLKREKALALEKLYKRK